MAVYFTENRISWVYVQSLGFAHIGTYPEVGFKHGAWHDVGYWRIALDSTSPPKLSVPFSEISLF